MRRKLWYNFIKNWIKIGFFFYFKRIEIVRLNQVSKTRPSILLPNHQNTFLDALAIAVTYPRMSHYMARADIFNSPRLIWLMSTVNLRPIYRIRDGKEAIKRNTAVFNQLVDFLNQGESVMIHPEGTHSLDYRVKPLKNGFTKLAYDYLEKNPDKDIDIVPVGINYENHTDFRSKLSVHYGTPISARKYYEQPEQVVATQELMENVRKQLCQLTVNITPEKDYEEKYEALLKAGTDFSNLEETQKQLALLNEGKELKKQPPHPNLLYKLLLPFSFINNILLILLWKKLKPIFKDPAWHGSIKFCIGTFVGPFIYLFQWWLVYVFVGTIWSLIYLYFSLSIVNAISIIQTETRRRNSF